MALNFLRKYRLTIVTSKGRQIVIDKMHVDFDVRLTDKSEINELEITIFNLSQDTLSVFEEVDAQITLEVGYGDNPLALLFKGNKTHCSTKREDTEVITKLIAGDGAVTVREARTQTVSPTDSTVEDIIRKIVKDSMPEITTFNLNGDGLKRKYPRGYSATGNSKQALDKICRENNLKWHITNNDTINVQAINGDIKKKAIVITPTMIKNTPEKTTKEVAELKDDLNVPKKLGLNLKLQLNPLFVAGNLVKVEGTFNSDGVYVINTVKHSGSFEGDTWDTDIECSNYP